MSIKLSFLNRLKHQFTNDCKYEDGSYMRVSSRMTLTYIKNHKSVDIGFTCIGFLGKRRIFSIWAIQGWKEPDVGVLTADELSDVCLKVKLYCKLKGYSCILAMSECEEYKS